MLDPEIYVTMTASMLAVQKAVSTGYVFYVSGSVEATRALALVAKLESHFPLGSTDKQREYAAKKKRCSFRLVLFPMPGRTDLYFCLFRTDGSHPLLRLEHWRDARRDPIAWPFFYELRQVPVPPEHRKRFRRKNGRMAINPVTWTWRFNRGEMDRLRACIRHWVQMNDERLRRLIRGLSFAPGFRAVRDDVYTLHRYIEGQCRRRDVPVPEFPRRRWIALTKGKSFRTYPLTLLVRRVGRGQPWFPSDAKAMDTVVEPTLMENPDAQAVQQTRDVRDDQAADQTAQRSGYPPEDTDRRDGSDGP